MVNFSAKVSLDKIRYRFTKIFTLTTEGGITQINDYIFVLYRGVLVKNKEIKGGGSSGILDESFLVFPTKPVRPWKTTKCCDMAEYF